MDFYDSNYQNPYFMAPNQQGYGGYGYPPVPNYGGNVLPWQVNQQQPQQNSLSSLLQAIPSIQYSMKGLNTGPQAANAQQIGQVANAQMNIDNPLYKKLYGQFRQQGQDALSQGVNEIGMQNRKLASLGRVPLLDQERGGEQLWRGLMQGYQQNQNQAGVNAQGALGAAGQTLGNAFTANSNLALQQNQSQYQKAKGQTGIVSLLSHLFNLG